MRGIPALKGRNVIAQGNALGIRETQPISLIHQGVALGYHILPFQGKEIRLPT